MSGTSDGNPVGSESNGIAYHVIYMSYSCLIVVDNLTYVCIYN